MPAGLPALLVCLALSGPAVAANATFSQLGGRVQDSSGGLIEGAVVIISSGRMTGEVRTSITTADGSYRFTGLAPGIYQLMVVKAGYLSVGGRANTLLRSTLDFVLRPRTGNDPEVADDLDWVLRLPPRDILRDLESARPDDTVQSASTWAAEGPVVDAVRAEPASSAPAQLELPLAGEVQQWFTSESPLDSGDGAGIDSSGSRTALRLAMRVGERIDLEVEGERGRADSSATVDQTYAGLTSSDDSVGLAVGYDIDGASRLNMQAAYGRDSLQLAGEPTGLYGLPQGERVTRSASTSWRTVMNDGGSVDVSALYMDSVDRAADFTEASGEPDAVNRLWRAGGEYRKSLGEDHQVSVGFRARMLQLGESEDRALAVSRPISPVSLAGPLPAGWGLHLHGAEQWTITPMIALNTGLDYHRSLSYREAQHLIPQAGVTVSPLPSTRVRASMSYLIDSYSGAGSSAVPPSPVSRDRRVGYEVEVEQRLGRRTELTVGASSEPIAYQYADETPALPSLEDRPIYVSDGQAESREVAVELTRRFRRLSASVGAVWGRVAGYYAVSLPGEPLLDLHRGEMRYVVTSVTARTDDSGTEIRIELRSLDESLPGADSLVPSDLSRLTVFLAQDLPFIRIGETRWRFMLSAENNLGVVSHEAGDEGLPFRSRYSLAQNRLSGGVSVQF